MYIYDDDIPVKKSQFFARGVPSDNENSLNIVIITLRLLLPLRALHGNVYQVVNRVSRKRTRP